MSGKNSVDWNKLSKVVFIVLILAVIIILGFMFYVAGDSKKARNIFGESPEKNSVSEVTNRVARSEMRTNNEQQVGKEVKMVTVASKKHREMELRKKIAEEMKK
jgi:Tfp pilus assembly protein PilO